ncbi:MAG: tripartite tricarboxylate transporter substrate binding protein [Pseudomonadota bacterium]
MRHAWTWIKATLLAATVALLPQAPALAADFPVRPIRIIVPFPPGGITDVIARQVAKGLGDRLGQSVVIDNKPSAGHVLSLQLAAQAQPDGYTILLGSNTGFTVTPHVYQNLGVDVTSFPIIAPINTAPTVLLARPDFLANNMEELVKLAKARPGVLNYGSFGVGTSAHLGMEIFKRDTGIEITHIPYKGDAPAILALLSKEVDVAFVTLFSSQKRIIAGEFKALGVLQAARITNFPNTIQTTVEAGSKNADMPVWIAFFAPPKTPPDIVKKLEEATRAVTGSTEFRDFLRERGSAPMEMDNGQLAQFIKAQSSRIAPIVKAIGLSPE